MHKPDLKAWAKHLRAVAEPVARAHPAPGGGDMALPVVAAVTGRSAIAPQSATMRPEVELWWMVAAVSAATSHPGARRQCDPPAALLLEENSGPLLPHGPYRAIEVWTDAELSSLHALWILARREGRADWRDRVAAAARWHLAHTQPDNATNRPWALHVFLTLGRVEAVLYAETLLHNALATEGGPAPLSAWIMLSSAAELEHA